MDLKTYATVWLYLIAILVIMSIMPAEFAITCWRITKTKYSKRKKRMVTKPMSTKDKLLSILPFSSPMQAYTFMMGEAGWTKIAAIVCPLLILPRLLLTLIPPLAIAAANVTALGNLQIWSIYLLVAGIIATQLYYFVTYMSIARLFQFNWLFYLLLFIIPQATVLYMVSQVPKQYGADSEELNDRFAGA